jgi:5-methylcytosine-specific restriction endonuclease McrA
MTKRKSISRKTRRLVRERAGKRCEYCLHPDSHACAFFAGEHVIPRAAGAGDTLDDLAWACPYCNNHKHTKIQACDP